MLFTLLIKIGQAGQRTVPFVSRRGNTPSLSSWIKIKPFRRRALFFSLLFKKELKKNSHFQLKTPDFLPCKIIISYSARKQIRRQGNLPLSPIRKQRLANAVKLLSDGHSVTEAAEMSVFADCSNFIY